MKKTPALDSFHIGEPLRLLGGNLVEAGGERLLYFAGCDYFRFASHPAILKALREAIRPDRWSVSASRLTTGNHPLYAEAEQRVAEFFGATEALLVTSGYLTNLVVTQVLAGEITHAIADENAHVSLKDSARFLNCPLELFPHRDAAGLRAWLKKLPKRAQPLVLTDGMFSRDGATAPLADYLAALPERGRLLVDDAHGAGTLGATGRGTPEYCGVADPRLIQTVTFSKAFGVYGGAVLCPPGLRENLAGRSHLFGGATPLPLPLVAGLLAALTTMQEEGPARRERLQANAAWLRTRLRQTEPATPDGPGPIFPIYPAPGWVRSNFRQRLLHAGIYPSLIRYPGGPPSGYLRFVVSSEHTDAQLQRLADALAAATPLH